MRKTPNLVYRARRKQDDSFLVRVTQATMQDVYEQSLGLPLDQEVILHQINNSDVTVIVEQDGRPVGYYSYLQLESDRIYWGGR